MTSPTTPTEAVKDRVKLPLTFDVERLQKEVLTLDLDNFIYYKVIPLRMPAHILDPSLPPPPPAEDFADGSWTDWANSEILKKSTYLREIVEFFQEHTTVNLVRLLRLAPGAVVAEHTDPTLGIEQHKSVVRLTIPIFSGEEVEFFLNNTIVPMQPGECWYMRLTDPHRINNHGSTERINFTIDMIPNDWLRDMILEAQN